MTNTKKGDFIEIRYKGYANGELFENIEEEVKKIYKDAKGEKTIAIIGQGTIVSGLDKDLEGKEIGKDYSVEFGPKEGFGERRKELIRTIPLKMFLEKKVNPQAGMSFNIDGQLVKIIAVSGARVIADFNNPLASKKLKYEYKIIRKVEDEKEKVEAVLKNLFRIAPEFEIREKVIVKGPKGFDMFVKAFNERFKELIGKELEFKEIESKKKEEKTSQ